MIVKNRTAALATAALLLLAGTFQVKAQAPQPAHVFPALTSHLLRLRLPPPQAPQPAHVFAALPSWQMISSPETGQVFGTPNVSTFAGAGLLLYAFQPDANSYAVTPSPPADTFHPGQGYWAFLSEPLSVYPGSEVDPSKPFAIPLRPGWNMIGNPFSQPVALSRLTVVGPAGDSTPFIGDLTTSPLYPYDSTTGQYQVQQNVTDTMAPWSGSWLYISRPANLVIAPPAFVASDYFPIQSGNTYTYQFVNTGSPSTSIETDVVQQSTAPDGTALVTFTASIASHPNFITTYLADLTQGVRIQSEDYGLPGSFTSYSPPLLVLPGSAEPGDVFNVTSTSVSGSPDGSGGERVRDDVTFQGFTTRTVLAGTFSNVAQFTTTSAILESSITDTTYYAPGVGLIETQHQETSTLPGQQTSSTADWQLLSATIGGQQIGSVSGGLQAGSPWPMFHHDLQHTGRGSGNQTRGTMKWKFTTQAFVEFSPAIGADGTIYLPSYGSFYAVTSDGALKWKFTPGTDFDFYSSPAIGADGTIYVGNDDHNLYAINSGGTLKWRFPTGNYVDCSPAVATDGTIYVGSQDRNLYAINPDGTLKWQFTTDGVVSSSPAIAPDGTVYAGGEHSLYAIRPDGTQKWILNGDFLLSAPAIGPDGTVYVGSGDHNLYAISPDGTLKWQFLTGYTVASPAIGADGTIYVGSYDSNLYAINSDGTLKWQFVTGAPVSSSPAIGADGVIYVGTTAEVAGTDHNLYAINSDGTLKWKFATPSYGFSSPAIGGDGTIYVGSGDGNLYAIE